MGIYQAGNRCLARRPNVVLAFQVMFESFQKHAPRLIGLILLYTGAFKLLHPGEATFALESLEISHLLADVAVISVTVLELYLGSLLAFKMDLKFSLGATMGLMFGFTVFLWYLSTLAHPPSCGCMGLTGMFNSTKHDALFGVFRNVVVLWVLKLAYDYHFKLRTPGAPAAESA